MGDFLGEQDGDAGAGKILIFKCEQYIIPSLGGVPPKPPTKKKTPQLLPPNSGFWMSLFQRVSIWRLLLARGDLLGNPGLKAVVCRL